MPLFVLTVEMRLPKLQVSEYHLICSYETENERKKKEIENEREKLRIIGRRRREEIRGKWRRFRRMSYCWGFLPMIRDI